jgi:hypothetical protein
MAATAQQGTYLATTLVGFTVFPAGLLARASHPSVGILAALVGLGLLAYSAFGLYRIKRLELTK